MEESRGGLCLFCELVYLVAGELAFANSPNKGFTLKGAARSEAEPISSLGFLPLLNLIVNNYRRTKKTESFLLFLKPKEKKRDRKSFARTKAAAEASVDKVRKLL